MSEKLRYGYEDDNWKSGLDNNAVTTMIDEVNYHGLKSVAL
jgi:hypothetical protein